jgi:probable phosphoglycerate mutase
VIWVVRHGETAWSLSGQHTGWNDIALTDRGREQALSLRERLKALTLQKVFVSPLQRAKETCRLAGFMDIAVVDPDLREWNYGDYEGFTREQIREKRPDWDLRRDGVQGGERLEEAAERAQRVIQRASEVDGDVALFAHGHILRILTSCWLGLTPDHARHFALETANIGALGMEHTTPVIRRWNS